MPLIKPHQGPSPKDTIVLDLGDLTKQADAILEKARKDAQAIIATAEHQADDVTHKAEAAGYKAGFTEGQQQGLQEGEKKGYEAAYAESLANFEKLTQGWQDGLDQLDMVLAGLDQKASEEVLVFALAFALKLTHRQIQVDRHVVVDQLAHALQHVLNPMAVSVRIHPDDQAVLDAAMPVLVQRFEQVKTVQLIADPSVDPGGCVVITGKGQIDATVQTQMRRVLELMLPSSDAVQQAMADFGQDIEADGKADIQINTDEAISGTTIESEIKSVQSSDLADARHESSQASFDDLDSNANDSDQPDSESDSKPDSESDKDSSDPN